MRHVRIVEGPLEAVLLGVVLGPIEGELLRLQRGDEFQSVLVSQYNVKKSWKERHYVVFIESCKYILYIEKNLILSLICPVAIEIRR